MSDTAATARRERAEKWCEENASSPLCSCYCEKAYLAGAREETTLIVMEIVSLQIENDTLSSMLQTTAACADRAIKEKAAKIATLREAIGLLTTLPGAESVDCGLQIPELASAIYSGVCNEIATLREVVRVLVSGDLTHRNCSADECMVAAIKNSGAVRRALEETP